MVQEVAGALGAAPPAALDPQARVGGVSIDSRTARNGELFVAIHGPNHDGHDFVASVISAGAIGAVVSRDRSTQYPESIRGKLFAVPDTLVALQEMARAVRRRWGKRIAAVTGSVGKTTTKEILAALVGSRHRMLKSEGNLNNEYGLPLALLRLEPEIEAAVVEMGMSHRGEIKRLAEIAEPEVAVVTRVAPVHLEFFSSVDEIALAKRELIEELAGPSPIAVLNADDSRVREFANVARGKVLTFGLAPEAEFRAENIEDRGASGSVFDLVRAGQRTRLSLALPGRHNVLNSLAALAAASVWGIGAREAAQVFPGLLPGEMRGRLLKFAEGFAVINDSYNSNPVALQAMLELAARTPGYRRRIVAAGQMLELGADSPLLHRQAGREAAGLSLDVVIAVAGDAAEFARGAVEAGLPAERVHFFSSSAEAAPFLAELVEPGDLVLVKGSRGVKMELLVAALNSKYAQQAEDSIAAAPRESL